MFKHHRHSIFILLLLLLCFLTACGQNQDDLADTSTTDTTVLDTTETDVPTSSDTSDDENILRIVTDKSEKFTINDLVKELVSDFEDSHPGITVELEILPEDVEERTIRLESLRAEIMAGDGPDVFLFPTANYGNRIGGLLFPDVVQSMHNGMFADISALYDADTELNKEQLQSTVMEAGVLDDARYVMPLWYSFETVLIDSAKLAGYGVSEEEITGSIQDFYDVVIKKNDHAFAVGANLNYSEPYTYFPQLLDYESGQVLVTEEKVSDYLKRFYQHMSLAYGDRDPDAAVDTSEYNSSHIGAYVSLNSFWRNSSQPAYINDLSSALSSYVLADVYGYGDVKAYPIRSADGSVTATVSYWGAISAGCDHVELAYDFLRMMLSEKAQWEIGRSAAGAGLSGSLYTSGYPVRIHGSVEYLITSVINMGSQATSIDDPKAAKERFNTVKQVELTDSDFPLLNVEIDNVHFPITCEIEFAYQRNTSIEYDPFSVPSDEEIDEWAKELVRELEYHIAEG